ncbi:MAG: PhnA domain-containing protein [Gammaproteobacteria bacterium]|nr:PhnA domain-containing protein [Gammaproteobacteria bacterium]
MSLELLLKERSHSKCELCSATDELLVFSIQPVVEEALESSVLICGPCKQHIENIESTDRNYWRCLNDSMWSQIPAIQVMVWRILNQIKDEGWPQDLLEMLYLDEETLQWAQSVDEEQKNVEVRHLDSNGKILEAGDTVILVKDLNVKGASFTAKRGTSVRGISLVDDNSEHIEGKIEGQRIVIMTKFVKKTA